MIEFQGFGKIARLYRDMVITEKIDGTNAAIGIVDVNELDADENADTDLYIEVTIADQGVYAVYAQSRKRLITPTSDNYGFARWVHENAVSLVTDLGPGLHFGEWWGSGCQRGYGLTKGEKRFSLFNVKRWNFQLEVPFTTKGLDVVPVLYTGAFDTTVIEQVLIDLAEFGSMASPGFMDPEGIVVYHMAANTMFKVTIKDDAKPKTLASITGSGGLVLPSASGQG